MAILLGILKWIGIILLAILVLILLIIIFVLASRLKYDVKGSYYGEQPNGEIKVSYLCSLLRVRAAVTDWVLDLKVRVFGIPVVKKQQRLRGEEAPSEEAEIPAISAAAAEPEAAPFLSAPAPESVPVTPPEKPAAAASAPEVHSSAPVQEKPKPEKKKAKKPAPAPEPVPAPEPEPEPAEEAGEKKDLWDKVSDLIDKKDEAYDILDDDDNRELIALILRQIGKIIKHVLPRSYSANVRFGMEDPAKTGQILAIASALYPVYAGNARVQADFEQKVLEGDADVKGGLRLGYILFALLRILFNKKARWWIKKLLKKDKKKDEAAQAA
ncbi:MAG: DUF2953 domain-containing protein [Lachnospiraceae bacterium]|nr:DUF2953 domain-containing protein [Lachnospiraceae bacterium]